MGYAQLRKNLIEFDAVIRGMRLSIEDGSLLKEQFDIVTEFLEDESKLTENILFEKWKDTLLSSFSQAQITVNILIDAVLALKDQSGLKTILNEVFAGSIIPNFEPNPAKDKFYELEMAMFLKNAGFIVELDEPDIVVSGHGLTKTYGIACKYLSSEKGIHKHISKGYGQLKRRNLDGFVMIGLEQIVFKRMSGIMDFRNIDRSEVTRWLKKEMINLVVQRKEDCPSEVPIQGAILTLTIPAYDVKPLGFFNYRELTFHCDNKNPMLADIKRIVSELNRYSQIACAH